ncbi:hypothetical protein [Alysiella crassa]|uniref:Uncharacterized protein n=1 Tax=Alysiella crassa TaxID=153491 RepID=A0A376BVM7_9NEIS|nr:hypothetical protein [Alysiella crassa]UOP06514.1 hypothetical protein LVJ80_12260 [Alysiella crassa]SSY81047.1 Uncharacterised protein [Alysiella crassa]
MTFAFYVNEEMTEQAADVLPHQFDLNQPKPHEFVLYLGSPDTRYKLVSEKKGSNITLAPALALPEWTANHGYVQGDLISENGFIFQCVQAGVSGESVPVLLNVVGSVVQDGAAIWRGVGKAYAVGDMKLALSSLGLAAARGGAAVSLGAELLGGAAVAVYVQISPSVDTPYLLENVAQFGIVINDCVVVPV